MMREAELRKRYVSMDKIVSISFIIIIFFVFIFMLISYIPAVEKNMIKVNFGQDARPKAINSKILHKELVFIEKARTKIDNSLQKHFPLFGTIIQASSDIDYLANKILYSYNDYLRYKPIPLKNGRFLINDEYIRNYRPTLLKNDVINQIHRSAHAINYVNRKLNKYGVSVFVMDEPWTKDLVSKNKIDYTQYFVKQLDSDIEIYVLENNQSTSNMYFKSDHHWNIYGAYQGYENIYKMLKINYQDIGKILMPNSFIELDKIKFQGSNARAAAVSFIKDDFYILDVDLPEYRLYINNVLSYKFESSDREAYLNNEVENLPYVGHYGKFYHKNLAVIQYRCATNTEKRNILIFSDSLSNCIEPLIASHYYNTFFIDLREYKGAFPVNSFLEENDISQVLFMGVADDLLLLYAKEDETTAFNLR